MKNNKGFTLTELIVTLAIIAILIIPVYNTFISSAKTNYESRTLISASLVAQNEMEEIKGMTKDEFGNYIDSVVPGDPDITENDFLASYSKTISNGGFEFDVEITVKNITETLNIAPVDKTLENVIETRDVSVEVDSPSDINNGVVSVSGLGSTDIPKESSEVILNFTSDAVDIVKLNILGNEYTLVNSEPKLFVDIYGNQKNIKYIIKNTSGKLIDIKKYDDEVDNVTITSHKDNTSSVLIGNSFPSNIANENEPMEWYNVNIKVTKDSSKYEEINSTVGK